MGTVKRVGHKERDMHALHILEAFAKGYLKETELQGRIDRVMEAVTETDLQNQVRDLPSALELAGKEVSPHRIRKLLTNFREAYGHHPLLTMTPFMLVSALVAILPSVLANNISHGHNGPVSLTIMVVTVITGVIGLFFSLAAMVNGTA
jgi:hypothetical protein